MSTKAGSLLTNESSDAFAVVIERGWSDERIRDAVRTAAADYDSEVIEGPYDLDVWSSYLAWQKREIGWPPDCDYWGPDGAGRRSINVAVFQS